MGISWHEECLKNMKISLQREETELKDIQSRVYNALSEIGLYTSQIDRAKREGKESFDREKYNIERKRAKRPFSEVYREVGI